MKATVDRKALIKALTPTRSVINSKSKLPILTTLHLIANGALKMIGTDLDNWVEATIEESKVEGKGEVCVLAKDLADFARATTAKTLTIDWQEPPDDKALMDKVRVIADGVTAGFDAYPVAEAPPVPKPGENVATEFTLCAKQLLHMIERVERFMSTDSSRYVLNGICVAIDTEGLTLVGTNGRILGKVSYTHVIGAPAQFILRLDAVEVLTKVLKAAGNCDPVTIRATYPDGTIGTDEAINARIQCGGYLLATRLIEGTYPNYKQVIPSTADNNVTPVMDTKVLRDALTRASKLAKDMSVKLTFHDGKLGLETRHGFETIAVDKDCPTEKPLVVAFNPHYLVDALVGVDNPYVAFRLKDGMSPVLIVDTDTPENPVNTYTAVVMPMRLS